jgi:phosphate acetyltransferase
MDLLERIHEKARKNPIKLCLPEGHDERLVAAGAQALDAGYATEVTLLAENKADAKAAADKADVDLGRFSFAVPREHEGFASGADEYYDLRKEKGVTRDEAEAVVARPVYYGAMMLRRGEVDGVVCGAATASADVVRAALHMVGLRPGFATLSSFFIMIFPDSPYGDDGVFFFADPAIVIDPTPEQIADIALATADNYRRFTGDEPRVALLSFSTKGSASHSLIDEVTRALEICKEREPDLVADGEMQFDAAVVPSVGERKAPDSPVAGRANCLIFPGLEAANIGYKIAERMAGARAIGPISQGLAKPMNDLSRGAAVDDIVDVIAFTALQAT